MTASRRPSLQKTRSLEAYLVASARMGEAAAVDKLVRLLQPRLLSHACRLLGDTEGAQDIVQAAWLDILAALPRLRDVSAFRVFALKIVTRKVARTIKGRQRDRSLADEWAAEAQNCSAHMGEIETDARTVRLAIAQLRPAHQAALALFYLEEMSVVEVAVAMDVPVGTVKTRLMHARNQLRTLLEGEDDE